MNKKLGKAPARVSPKLLGFANYLTEALPEAPARVSWADKNWVWPMLDNDKVGDCTIAGAAHLIQMWTLYAGRPTKVTLDQVMEAYKAVSGYDGTEATDNGANLIDVLNYWRTQGIGGHRISAFMGLDRAHLQDEMKHAIHLFGAAYVGVNLPKMSQDQDIEWVIQPDTKAADAEPGSWGGHLVPAIAYDGDSVLVVTWGGVLAASWEYLQEYCDEAYAVLSMDWIASKGGIAPNGFNIGQLQKDLIALRV